ncbi:glycosyltransferase [Paenibacillus radicis (ex Xue et al. 2023)]|uniref:Glycosyltransferase n=1 Tax=Paenibacillus radicis (ex Xue et al. 2023) TaxID=2972489 RepID=A0ABT1YM19_9BACL|nr:glycosyltransferase [Paenibacillus radicis (ex Xue et al. 2023)]MCR8633015.1 glycosyltransferase [Paenibacillus radicis (ex Xue et al. 2023)]
MGSLDDQEVRVLMMLDAFDIGGTETHVLSLTQALLEQGVSVYVAGDSGPLESKFRMLSCKIYNYKIHSQKFEDWIRINKINVIHAHMESSGIYAMQLCRKLNIPLIYTIHGIYYNDSVLSKLLLKYSIKPTIISVSIPVQKWLEKKGLYSSYIPNGIDTKEFSVKKSDLREQLDIPEHSKVILYASRLEEKKYEICKLLLMACEQNVFEAFPDVRLLIAGGGMNAEEINTYINQTNSLKRIQYIGNRNDMSDLYSTCDYVVGTGRVALEAISCECPVIAIGTMGTFGLVTPDNFRKAMRYYFCDHKSYLPLEQNSITKAVIEGLCLKEQDIHWSKKMRREVIKRMEISIVTTEIIQIYKKKVWEMEVCELR